MPIHHGYLNRRRFLSGALGAGATLCTPGLESLLAGSTRGGPESWALLSDTHISGKLGATSRGVCMVENLHAVVRDVVGSGLGRDGLLVNGDCAHLHGRETDYGVFSELIQPLGGDGLPVHLLLGNHDEHLPFIRSLTAWADRRSPLEGKHVSVVRGRNANWFLLDSNLQGSWHRGEFGRLQLRWLSNALDLYPDQPAIVVGHHHPECDSVSSAKTFLGFGNGLRDTRSFLELLHSKPQVQAYVFGHTHRWTVDRTPGGIYLINLPPVAYVFEKSRPSGWVHATVGSNGLTLRLRALERRHPEHGDERFLPWRRA